jgi:hypothetical protein
MEWIIVQHSGFEYGGKPGFGQAAETRMVSTARQRNLVEKAGGVLFENCVEAEEFSELANYPEGSEGIYPRAFGSFSPLMIGGLRIYIPARQVTD